MDRRTFLRSAALGGAAAAAGMPGGGVVGAAAQGATDAAADPPSLPLGGSWAFRAAEEGEDEGWRIAPVSPGRGGWTAAQVPGCWERDGRPASLTGPALYRNDLVLPQGWKPEPGRTRLWWECDAVSYHAEGWVNGRTLGAHTGLWDAFAWEIPAEAVAADERLALALRCEKPGSERFPVRETMAGFLPYVWGTWGGPWQETRLRLTGPVTLRDLFAPGKGDGTLAVEVTADVAARLAGKASLRVELKDPQGRTVAEQQVPLAQSGEVRLPLAAPRFGPAGRWSPESPVLYTVVATAFVDGRISDRVSRAVGFRDIAVDGERILLNGQPVYLRMPLSWGWYEGVRAPNPDPKLFEEELRRTRELGFNGMKLCLWIPPRAYFEIADRMGMLLWVELPMWLPKGTERVREQTPAEYGRITRQIGDHPSIVAWTVGCEIGAGIDAAFLAGLYTQVKARTGSPLVRDNSGSAECYGGPMPESADFHDFHLYCDLPQARETFASFHPAFRERQPFLFGEFCDQDALRDLPGLIAARKGKAPWWATEDKESNPQGVRWEYNVVRQAETMRERGLLDRIPELREGSRLQALLTRKVTLELVRSQPHMGGYVVTGLVDTPISSAGLFDDFGRARFSGAEMLPFNGDTVVFCEPDRRREWTAGGDRAHCLDRFCAWGGTEVRRHLGVSHYGRASGPATVRWQVFRGDGSRLSEGRLERAKVAPGDVLPLGLFTFRAPAVTTPERLTLAVELSVAGAPVATNSWPFWVFPKPAKRSGTRVGLLDPAGHLAGLGDAVAVEPLVPLSASDGRPTDGGAPVAAIIATVWRPELREFALRGGKVLLVQPGASAPSTGSGLPAVAVPFWREAMRLFERHPSWGAFPHNGVTDLLFYGLAGDAAFETDKVKQELGLGAHVAPVLTRVDARSFALHGYTLEAEVGAGSLLLTTLRPQGGLGDTPSGLSRNVAGTYLLRTWLDWLLAA